MRPSLLTALLAMLVLLAPAARAGDAAPAPASSATAPSAAEAPAAAITGSTAAAPPAAPVWRRLTIENASARVEISTYRASIGRMYLLSQHPISLPKWRAPGLEPVDTKAPLAILDGFNAERDMHNFLEGAGLPVDPAQEGSWTPRQISPGEIEFTKEHGGLAYAMHYRMDQDKPQVHVQLRIANRGAQAVAVAPRVRTIDGVHQDDPVVEAGFQKIAAHAGGEAGELETWSFPDAGAGESIVTEKPLDYVGLKSRFFAAWWTPGGASLVQDGTEAPLPHKLGLRFEGFEGRGHGGLYQQAMLNVTWFHDVIKGDKRDELVGLPLKSGAELRVRWSLAVSTMTKDELGKLDPIEKRLEYTDAWYDFFKSIANVMTWALRMIAGVVHWYGLAVILLTFLVKALLHRLTYKQYESMMKMQKLAPDLKYLQEQYKDNRQQLAVKQMELWKKNGVNPLGGCLPVLIQIPIFIALYQSFYHSADMRGQPFLWIRDLTLPDQVLYLGFHLPLIGSPVTINPLPLIYIAVTVWMSMMQKPPTGGDPQQEQMFKMMRWLPVIFGVIFYNMPAGLVLYFTIQAVLSTLEIKLVKHRLGMP